MRSFRLHVLLLLALLLAGYACDSGAEDPSPGHDAVGMDTGSGADRSGDGVTPSESTPAGSDPPAMPGGDTSDPGAAGSPAVPSDADAGALDAAGADGDLAQVAPVVGCIDRALQWSFGGWFGWGLRTWTLAPCRTFSYTYSKSYASPSIDASCMQDVAADSGAELDQIDALLGAPDVLEALSAGSQFDEDPGVADAPDFEIEIEGLGIALGIGCGSSAPGCVVAPANVKRLRAALEQLADEQLQTGDCEGLP